MKKNDAGASNAGILLIDDDADVRKSIELFLSTNGFSNVESADGALEGIRMATTKRYDLILLDMIMPRVSGWGVLEKISDKKVKTRVLVLSAVGLPQVVEKEVTQKYPTVGFLPKTSAASDLVEKVKEMLAQPAGAI
ncbi:MAG: response regulator [Candidatus Micrarchaeia archaeon]|jgi:DNA-binding response OmpR family regulator